MCEQVDNKWLVEFVLQFMQSPSFNDPLQAFVDEKCSSFDDFEEENKLEYQELHNEFKNLVDNLLAAHLLEVDVSPEDFEQKILNAGLADNPALASVMSKLLAAEDFIVFKGLMVDKHAEKQMQALSMLKDTSEDFAAAQALQAVENAEQPSNAGSLAALRSQVNQAAASSESVSLMMPTAEQERKFMAGGGSYGRATAPSAKTGQGNTRNSKASVVRQSLVSALKPR
eukprot:gnl/MRDRNA2_/MRDRNA2_54931_c0_seq1.p1 gnl/MRDRNA2_/MRDRNA2_54931_c0~~gnl/MRDRNA2_/MRDRNA2_54931_c0_seq1.p1  ORF type:complete len:228 (+),score=66.61 gnl/MRDRNA2_/MRDRNA2_54931_c0_seq1:82-765(+)